MTAQNYFFNGPNAPTVLKNAISFLNRLDLSKPWKVTVDAHKKSRTRKQDRALWGVAYPAIADHFGYSGDEQMKRLHWNFCGDCFGWVDGPLGFKVPRHTTSTDENGEKKSCSAELMAKLYDHIQRTAAEYGCDVPDPDPLWFIQSRGDE